MCVPASDKQFYNCVAAKNRTKEHIVYCTVSFCSERKCNRFSEESVSICFNGSQSFTNGTPVSDDAKPTMCPERNSRCAVYRTWVSTNGARGQWNICNLLSLNNICKTYGPAWTQVIASQLTGGGQRGHLPRALRSKGAPMMTFICFK